jgi:hypothetical protein
MAHGDLAKVEAPISDRLVILTGIVTLGASGAVSSQDCEGFSVVQTGSETGRYTATLNNRFLKVQYAHCVVEGAADAAVPNGKATVCQLRSVTGASLFFQMLHPNGTTAADALPEDSAKLRFFIVLSRGKL